MTTSQKKQHTSSSHHHTSHGHHHHPKKHHHHRPKHHHSNEKKPPSSATDAEQPKPSSPPIGTYLLAHATSSSSSTLKACVASIINNIKLLAAPESLFHKEIPFVHGPALLSSSGDAIVFGGNGICKALCLLGGCGGSSSSHWDVDAKVDDWLEFEREMLRSDFEKAFEVLENVLVENGGETVVGDCLTAADISIVITLHHHLAQFPDTTLPPTLSSYHTYHMTSPPFQSALTLASTLTPPPPFPFQTSPSLLKAVSSIFHTAISTSFPLQSDHPVNVSKCSNPKHGDYQCNAAMSLFAKLKKSHQLPTTVHSPQALARIIIHSIPHNDEDKNPLLDHLSVNGPGFIVCRIKPSFLQIHINTLLQNGPPRPLPLEEKCVVDFSSPNIAKEMHVGHLRSTIIGEAVCRLLEYAGCEVERVNHVGDWGTQFGMLIQYLKEEYGQGGLEEDKVNITDLTKFYKSAKERFDSDPTFKKTSQNNVVHLQSGDTESLRIWNLLCKISRREFQKVYDRLDITLKECGESFYNDKIPSVISELEEKHLVRIEEGGAKCVFVPGFNIPLMVQKSDGGYGYDSTDMAALKYRLQELNATKLVYVTDFSQGDHFQMCFKAAEQIGWIDKNQTLIHIGFGTVQGEDGKRFKTRSGDTVRLVDLLDEAVARMKSSLEERMKESKVNITAEEIPNVAAILGYSAVKYFDLRKNPTSNYVFSYDRMLDTKGNTAIYLLYAHARLESICTKAKVDYNVDVDDLIRQKKEIRLQHSSETNLALQLHQFADVVESTLEDLYPYHICEFLYQASIAVSDFVTQCKVLGTEEMESRLLLCRATAMVMRKCFDLLGIRYVMRI